MDVILAYSAYYATPCRYWLQGPKQGTSEIFIDNLPGPPDGISKAQDGQTFWVTIYSPVSE